MEMESTTVAFLDRKLQENISLLGLLAPQSHMVRENIERLIGELLSMQLVVKVLVSHIYHLQFMLMQFGEYSPWLFL